jgi:hypothetical protein
METRKLLGEWSGLFGRRWVGALILAAVLAGPAAATTIEELARKGHSLEERTQFTCPEPTALGSFSEPVSVAPSPEMPVWADYSGDDDLVRLIGDETELFVSLGTGDDTALLYEAAANTDISGGEGADTIMLCSMTDLIAHIGLVSIAEDHASDVVVIGSAVFTTVPTGMMRRVLVGGFNAEDDRLVLRAPPHLLESRQPSAGGFRIGDVIISVLVPPLDAVGFDPNDPAYIFIPEP